MGRHRLRLCIALDYRRVCGEVATEGPREVPLCERHWDALRRPLELAAETAFLQRRGEWQAEQRAEWRRHHQAHGVVYYVRRHSDDLIKIGTSASLQRRLQWLELDHGTVELLATEPGSFAEEAIRHELFAVWRVEGEWFTPARDLLDHIDRLRAREDPPLVADHAAS